MANCRIEKDFLGQIQLSCDCLYGIHTARAIENFALFGRRVNPDLIHAYGAVKLACARCNKKLGFFEDSKFDAVARACDELVSGELDEHIVVDALQGGAGTSLNMNVNEVIANRALSILGNLPGSYEIISPIEDVNKHQSTNDTYPTALKVAAIWKLDRLEEKVARLLEKFQEKEKQFSDFVKVGRTQLQDAVLITLGREMGSYAEALVRDRWRIYKCKERLRVVNLGGTAIGTGLSAPRKYIFRVVDELKEITSLGLARAENLVEATQNTDVFVEVSGIIKALASNLMKIANDIRLLSSGPKTGLGEINIPQRQAGSSVMPLKVNPVITEAVMQVSIAVFGNDTIVTQACSMGNLELNQFMPVIAESLLSSLDLLTNACDIFEKFCVSGITANKGRCNSNVENSTATVTALVEKVGYKTAQQIGSEAIKTGKPIRQIVLKKNILTEDEFENLISPENVTRLGWPMEPGKNENST